MRILYVISLRREESCAIIPGLDAVAAPSAAPAVLLRPWLASAAAAGEASAAVAVDAWFRALPGSSVIFEFSFEQTAGCRNYMIRSLQRARLERNQRLLERKRERLERLDSKKEAAPPGASKKVKNNTRPRPKGKNKEDSKTPPVPPRFTAGCPEMTRSFS